MATLPKEKTLLRLLLLLFSLATVSLVVLRLSAENFLEGAAGSLLRGELDEGVRGGTDSIELWEEAFLTGESSAGSKASGVCGACEASESRDAFDASAKRRNLPDK